MPKTPRQMEEDQALMEGTASEVSSLTASLLLLPLEKAAQILGDIINVATHAREDIGGDDGTS